MGEYRYGKRGDDSYLRHKYQCARSVIVILQQVVCVCDVAIYPLDISVQWSS